MKWSQMIIVHTLVRYSYRGIVLFQWLNVVSLSLVAPITKRAPRDGKRQEVFSCLDLKGLDLKASVSGWIRVLMRCCRDNTYGKTAVTPCWALLLTWPLSKHHVCCTITSLQETRLPLQGSGANAIEPQVPIRVIKGASCLLKPRLK